MLPKRMGGYGIRPYDIEILFEQTVRLKFFAKLSAKESGPTFFQDSMEVLKMK